MWWSFNENTARRQQVAGTVDVLISNSTAALPDWLDDPRGSHDDVDCGTNGD
jgi:hypothetical protein